MSDNKGNTKKVKFQEGTARRDVLRFRRMPCKTVTRRTWWIYQGPECIQGGHVHFFFLLMFYFRKSRKMTRRPKNDDTLRSPRSKMSTRSKEHHLPIDHDEVRPIETSASTNTHPYTIVASPEQLPNTIVSQIVSDVVLFTASDGNFQASR